MAAALFKQDGTEKEGHEDPREAGDPAARGAAGGAPRSTRGGSSGGNAGRGSRGRPGASVVASGTEITGEVTTQGDLRIEGNVEGDVHTRGEVVISDRGSVNGDVQADTVVVEGRIDGTVTAREVARLMSGCRVTADLRSPAVQLEEGARFDGRIEMDGASGSAERSGRPGAGESAPGAQKGAPENGAKSAGPVGGKASEEARAKAATRPTE